MTDGDGEWNEHDMETQEKDEEENERKDDGMVIAKIEPY